LRAHWPRRPYIQRPFLARAGVPRRHRPLH
jgi:hypothetical protein